MNGSGIRTKAVMTVSSGNIDGRDRSSVREPVAMGLESSFRKTRLL